MPNEKPVRGNDRKQYPLKVSTPIWNAFVAAKNIKAPHLSVNDAIIGALIQYTAAMEAGQVVLSPAELAQAEAQK